MEFSVLISWVHHFLLIMGGWLILVLLLLISSSKYTKNKFKQMEENDKDD
ncbi:hypothetical protein NDK43_23980 [Neobacillus pocheonensis]|uniref:Uncharacterized protein n=1 Tax=Neobacillus pocheonensis TaxID=363869 RepID=A0ABT0WEV1_9BACI|nr:hypothetical protein [Neobacillus pocheonensis]MCM2534841.1 hypothetical protein [Neobacillus pocheonensis]